VRRERSSSKKAVDGERTVDGIKDSEAMVQRRPRCSGLETRDWKAVWSSWEA